LLPSRFSRLPGDLFFNLSPGFAHRENANSTTKSAQKIAAKPVFHKGGENLYRLESTGGYYAVLKQANKQFRRALKTRDRKLAELHLAELRSNVSQCDCGRIGQSFIRRPLAKRWISTFQYTLRQSTGA
jgi:hypothetical protein